MNEVTAFKDLESLTDYTIRAVGSGIEIFGVLIIVTGIAWSTYLHLRRPMPGENTEAYKTALVDRFYLALKCWSLPTSSRPLRMN
jgi:ABC-type transport system involved in cytochrome c biogenesis permease subunit